MVKFPVQVWRGGTDAFRDRTADRDIPFFADPCRRKTRGVPREVGAAGPLARLKVRMKLLLILAIFASLPVQADTLRIGSKRFTESYILGEVLRRQVEGITAVEHKPGLGSTGIVFAALKAGSIDLYPEYTGTIAKEILKLEGHSG